MSGSGADGRKSIRRRSSNTALQHVFAVIERTRATESADRRRRANTPAGRATDIANYLSLPAKLVRRQHDRDGRRNGLTEIAGLGNDGLDNDGRIWAIDCNQLKITIERFYQLTGTYNSFESVLCLKTDEIHIYKQKL